MAKQKAAKIEVRPCTWDGKGRPIKYQAVALLDCADKRRRMFVGEPAMNKNESLVKLYAEVTLWHQACLDAKEEISGTIIHQ